VTERRPHCCVFTSVAHLIEAIEAWTVRWAPISTSAAAHKNRCQICKCVYGSITMYCADSSTTNRATRRHTTFLNVPWPKSADGVMLKTGRWQSPARSANGTEGHVKAHLSVGRTRRARRPRGRGAEGAYPVPAGRSGAPRHGIACGRQRPGQVIFPPNVRRYG
jgi:hypothetical protein